MKSRNTNYYEDAMTFDLENPWSLTDCDHWLIDGRGRQFKANAAVCNSLQSTVHIDAFPGIFVTFRSMTANYILQFVIHRTRNQIFGYLFVFYCISTNAFHFRSCGLWGPLLLHILQYALFLARTLHVVSVSLARTDIRLDANQNVLTKLRSL